MANASFTCSTCGNDFTLPASVIAKYPNWTPAACMDCRKPPARAAAKPVPGKRGASSVTRTMNLPLAEVLARFTSGPTTGVFTDGSCQPNPGRGGWGAVFVRDNKVIAQDYGYEAHTTNNRMELLGMISGLSMLSPNDAVDVYSDSQLVVKTLTQWAASWEKQGWKRKSGPVENLELVQRAYAIAKERPLARIQWIRAHDGSRWNEYADALSTAHLRDEL